MTSSLGGPDLAGDVPCHVAIIMDGNGRWAAARGLPRKLGHRRGIEAVRRTVRGAMNIGIQYLTLFGFSSENWSRPASEVSALMDLMRRFFGQDIKELHENNVVVRIIGERGGLAPDILRLIEDAEALTADNTGLTLTVAFNYGSQAEIVEAAKRIAEQVLAGEMDPQSLTAEAIENNLYTAFLPPLDLLIRTSGEKRLSNFLLWQAAYAELVFTDVLWPDFDEEPLRDAVSEYVSRERRFGRTSAEPAL